MTETKQSREVQLRIANPHDAELPLILEPWGETYVVSPHGFIDVLGSGPATDTLEVSFARGAVTVWGWPGSVVCVAVDANHSDGSEKSKVPVPTGDAEVSLVSHGTQNLSAPGS